ncbi:MAG: class I SAM-dependent methyltransferase [Planctomycetota bacterium]
MMHDAAAGQVTLDLEPRGVLTRNDEHDPLPYYYHPLVGWLYRRRLQMALDLLPAGAGDLLEVGVGSGVMVRTLTRVCRRYTGIDLAIAPGVRVYVTRHENARLLNASLLSLPFRGAAFDAIFCVSVLEHIAAIDAAARELARVLRPGGRLVVGYPMVNPWMTQAFRAIGYDQIDANHVMPPARIEQALDAQLQRVARRALPPAFPVRGALYQTTAWCRA